MEKSIEINEISVRLPKEAKNKDAEVKKIIEEIRVKFRELDELKKQLDEKADSPLPPKKVKLLLEEINVPALDIIREKY